MKKRNIYHHSIDLCKLRVRNVERNEFAKQLEKIPYRGYEVEDREDGRKIVIVKPGGKQAWGKMRKEDFFVFIYNPAQQSLWQITHKQIYEDLCEKAKANRHATVKILEALKRVYKGEDPNEILETGSLENPAGENPEALLKAYKWIWGQEDVNYPSGEGRAMSWAGLKELLKSLKGNEADEI